MILFSTVHFYDHDQKGPICGAPHDWENRITFGDLDAYVSAVRQKIHEAGRIMTDGIRACPKCTKHPVYSIQLLNFSEI